MSTIETWVDLVLPELVLGLAILALAATFVPATLRDRAGVLPPKPIKQAADTPLAGGAAQSTDRGEGWPTTTAACRVSIECSRPTFTVSAPNHYRRFTSSGQAEGVPEAKAEARNG